jgi:hypothetical protein
VIGVWSSGYAEYVAIEDDNVAHQASRCRMQPLLPAIGTTLNAICMQTGTAGRNSARDGRAAVWAFTPFNWRDWQAHS